LRWEYVDLDANSAIFHNPKTGTGHTVPLFGDALIALRSQMNLERDGCSWVYPSPITDSRPAAFDSAFARARRLAGLDAVDAAGFAAKSVLLAA